MYHSTRKAQDKKGGISPAPGSVMCVILFYEFSIAQYLNKQLSVCF